MKFDHLRATYFEECAELIESAYAQLTALADGNANDDTVHALFRAIHSVKGGGGAFGAFGGGEGAHAGECAGFCRRPFCAAMALVHICQG